MRLIDDTDGELADLEVFGKLLADGNGRLTSLPIEDLAEARQ